MLFPQIIHFVEPRTLLFSINSISVSTNQSFISLLMQSGHIGLLITSLQMRHLLSGMFVSIFLSFFLTRAHYNMALKEIAHELQEPRFVGEFLTTHSVGCIVPSTRERPIILDIGTIAQHRDNQSTLIFICFV